MKWHSQFHILFPLVERCGFSLAGPESHSWGVVIDSKLLRKKFFQAARQSWHRFKRFCVELLGHRHTSSLVPYPETEMLGKDRRRASRWIKAKKRELSTGWWKLKKEKGNRIPSSNCQWTRSKLNLHWRSNDFHISDFLIFGENTANLMRMTQTQVLYRSFTVSGRGSDAPNSDATPVRLSTRIYTKLLVGLQVKSCWILCQSMSIFAS